MMRKTIFLCLLLTLLPCAASAAKARSINSENASVYHALHIASHTGEDTCRVTANYLRVRTQDGQTVIGHVEQADTFVIHSVTGQRAYIEIKTAAPSSPDSWPGLSGWVSTDYIDCACSDAAYYGKTGRAGLAFDPTVAGDALALYAPILDWHLGCCTGEISVEEIEEHGFEPTYRPDSLQFDGYVLRDLDGDGSPELIVMSTGSKYDVYQSPVYAVYTAVDGEPVRLLHSWVRNRHFLREDGSFYNEGSNGAPYSIYGLIRVADGGLTYEYVLSDEDIWHYTTDNDFDFSNDETITGEQAEALIAGYGFGLTTEPEGFVSFAEYAAE